MADTTKSTSTKVAEGVVADTGDHDRVAMLSVAKDGTLDQYNPEIIGDKDAALEATKEQFRQIAVAAVDADKRDDLGLGGTGAVEVVEDKTIGELKAAHEAAEKSAEKKAEQVVIALSAS